MTVKPVHRVFGSKTRVAGAILALVPPGRSTWVEIFAGSAALTLAKAPHPSEHLNDLDGDIVNLFRVMRDRRRRARLIELIALTPWAEQDFNEQRALKSADFTPSRPVDRAWAYLVRSWMGVSGDSAKVTGFKFDKTASKQCCQIWDRLPDRLAVAAQRLKRVHIHSRPAVEMVERFGRDPDNVLFIDPPYPPRSINTHGSPYRVDMSDGDHDALIAAMRAARASLIVTMAADTAYDTGLADWRRFDLTVRGLRNAEKVERIFVNFAPSLGGLFEAAA